jgi:2-methylcitrate dehydratase PrpD
MDGYTDKLARFCSGLEFEAIPENIVGRIKWVILDNLGNIIGGTALDFGKSMAAFTRSLGESAEESTVLGFGFKTSVRNTAFANGSIAEILEMQDGYTKGGYHPCSGTISASLAMTEWKKKTGKGLIAAVVAGYEVGNRVSEAIHPSHLFKGFLPTGTVGTIGAAAAAANVLQLDQKGTFNALGIAGFILPICTGDNNFGRGQYGDYTIKPVQGGAAAKSGIEAALLAQHGLNGAALEGDTQFQKGFCRIVTDEPPRFDRMVEGLGKDYHRIEELYFKPYASCRMNHAPADIAIELKNKHGLRPEDIKEVLIRTYGFAAASTGTRRTNTESSFMACQFSMSYVVAAALTDGQFSLNQLTEEKIKDSRIHELAGKVKAVMDPELEKIYPANRPAIVEITTKDGKKFTGRADFAKGDHRKPMTEEESISKFLGLTTGVLGEQKAKKAVEMVLRLEKVDSLGELVNCLKSGK